MRIERGKGEKGRGEGGNREREGGGNEYSTDRLFHGTHVLMFT